MKNEKAKGQQMANEQNLKVLSPNEARELGRIGGMMSGKTRRERKKLREMVLTMASSPMTFDNEYNRKRFIEKYHIDNPTIIDGILAQLVSSALYPPAFEGNGLSVSPYCRISYERCRYHRSYEKEYKTCPFLSWREGYLCVPEQFIPELYAVQSTKGTGHCTGSKASVQCLCRSGTVSAYSDGVF